MIHARSMAFALMGVIAAAPQVKFKKASHFVALARDGRHAS